MAEVIWLPQVFDDIARFYGFLKEKNPEAAVRAVQAIFDAGDSLDQFPRRGALMGDGSGRRKLRVDFGKYGYVIHYIVEDEVVLILRVHDGRENRPI